MNDYGCEKCWPADANEAWEALTNIPIEARLIDESHYIVSIRACPSCTQHFLQVTTETTDWADGEDPIYRTVITIDDEERAKLTASTPLEEDLIEGIGVGRQSLKYDWPKNEKSRIYWSTGIYVGIHD